MTNKQIPVWIDCDTGTDDSVAIMLAHALPELSVIGLSAVAGNSPLYNTFPNTRRVVHLLGADYPVYPGAERPLMREPHVAGKFHGENGLGDVELPLPDTAPESTFAWDALYATAKRMPGELRLVATGPLTNVAIALTKYPELKQLLHSIALMGGAAVGGNVTPAAEFNIYDDPDAAQIVFKSGVPLVMCGLDVTMQAELRPADWDEMAAYGNRCGKLVRELFACAWSAVQTVGLTGVAQHDSCPIMYLAHPELFEGQMAGVFVETQAEITLGKTVTDLQSDKKFGKKNALVLLKLDREAFMQILKDCIRTLPYGRIIARQHPACQRMRGVCLNMQRYLRIQLSAREINMLSVQFLIADNKIGQFTRTDFANLCLLPKFLCRNACRGEDRLLLRNAEFHGLSHAVIQIRG